MWTSLSGSIGNCTVPLLGWKHSVAWTRISPKPLLVVSLPVMQAAGKLNVSIVNRGDGAGRHILNEQETRNRILREFGPDVRSVR